MPAELQQQVQAEVEADQGAERLAGRGTLCDLGREPDDVLSLAA